MRVDETQKVTPNGKANWMFVPLSEKNTLKAKSIFQKPLELRLAKLKQLNREIKTMEQSEQN